MIVYLMYFSIINNNIQCIGECFIPVTTLQSHCSGLCGYRSLEGMGWLGDIILNIMHVHDVDRAWTVHNTRHACDVVCDILTCYSTSVF